VSTVSYGEGVYLPNFTKAVPEAIQYGSFSNKDDCLLLALGSQSYSPVFVGDVGYNRDASGLVKVRVPLGRNLQIGGGSMPRAEIERFLTASKKKALCANDVFIVSQLGEAQ